MLTCIPLITQFSYEALWGSHVVGASYLRDTPVARYHQDGSQIILQSPVQVAEALHIQHVHLHPFSVSPCNSSLQTPSVWCLGGYSVPMVTSP